MPHHTLLSLQGRKPLGHMLERTPNYPQTDAATVGTTLSIWKEGIGWRVGYAATRSEKPQIETPRPSTKPAGLVPSATGHYASTTIEIALLSSISCGWVGRRVAHAERWGIGYLARKCRFTTPKKKVIKVSLG